MPLTLDNEFTQEELMILAQLLGQVNVKLDQAPTLLKLQQKLQSQLKPVGSTNPTKIKEA